MPIRRVYVKIDHMFEVDVPDELLTDDRAEELEEYVADHFEDTDWLFDEIFITDLDGNYV